MGIWDTVHNAGGGVPRLRKIADLGSRKYPRVVTTDTGLAISGRDPVGASIPVARPLGRLLGHHEQLLRFCSGVTLRFVTVVDGDWKGEWHGKHEWGEVVVESTGPF